MRLICSKNLSTPKLEKGFGIPTNKIKSITHILEIDNEHSKHLEIQQVRNIYLSMQQLQFYQVVLESSAQNIVFGATRIAENIIGTFQQVQVHQLSRGQLRGNAGTKLLLRFKIKLKKPQGIHSGSLPNSHLLVLFSELQKPSIVEILFCSAVI